METFSLMSRIIFYKQGKVNGKKQYRVYAKYQLDLDEVLVKQCNGYQL